MKKIKILYLIPQLLTGGTERHLCDLVTHLDKNKFETVVWCIGQWGPISEDITSAGIKVIYQQLRFYRIDEIIKAFLFIIKGNFDIFHSYDYGPNCIDGIISKLSGIPIIITSRRNMRHWKGGDKLHWCEKIRNRSSDIIIANSEAVKRKTAEIERVSPDKITVIYNGVNMEEINKLNQQITNTNIRRILGIPSNCIFIGNLANLKQIKGQEYFIHAFAKALKQTNKRLMCAIIGEGAEKNRLIALVKDLKIEKYVIITALNINRFEIINSFDIFVLSSLAEGFPNVIIEAMAIGKPVIATEVGGNCEAVVDDETGYTVPPKDPDALAKAIIDLVSNEKLRTELGRNGRKRFENYFRLEYMVKKHEQLYEYFNKK